MATIAQRQQTFGPYYFGNPASMSFQEREATKRQGPSRVGTGGGEPSPASLGNPNAPSLAPGAKVNTSFANMAQNAMFGNALSQPNPGLLSGNLSLQGLGNTALGGLLGAGVKMAGLGPASLISSALGKLSQFAVNRGLMGQDTSGLAPEANLAAMNQGGPISNAAFATLTQGLGLTPAQLDALSQNAPFGRAPSPDPEGLGPVGLSDVGGLGGLTGETGDPSGITQHKGGVTPKGPPRGPETRSTLLQGEYVVNPKATRLRRGLLEAINRGASKSELAKILKAGK